MTFEKQAALVAKHPLFFASHADSPSAEGRPGITCGDGWVGILDDLLTTMTPLLEATLHLSNPPRLYEIGVNNNRLRILLRPLTPEMAAQIYQAVLQSEEICERCGETKKEADAKLCPRCQSAS